jgi:nucleotide-binding universal stress UspA family protein
MRILLATDGSECSRVAVDEVARRPWPEGTEVRVISAAEAFVAVPTEPWVIPPQYGDQISTANREAAHAAADAAAEVVRVGQGDSVSVTSAVVVGAPKNAILEEAERYGADLIVLGSHGYRGIERFLLGSVSEAVATHAPCSVEIVRCREPRSDEA